MKPRDYCCCAIPIVNAGIYATLSEQLLLGILVGALALGTPSIVGAATPSFAPWVLGIVCFVASGIQILGFIGVSREKSILYRRYVTLHILLTVAAFAIAIAWIIASASRHSMAQSKCLSDFFDDAADSSTLSEGETLCNIFPWVDIGIMGGLWVVLAIAQFYFYVVVSSYGSGQRRDHGKYDSIYDPTNPLTSSIPMTNRADAWDSRPSADSLHNPVARADEYRHVRQDSVASVSDDLHQQPQDFINTYQDGSYPLQPGYPIRQPSRRGMPSQPVDAYTQEPAPTPNYNNDAYYTGAGSTNLDRPAQAQAHPAEGIFGRKTPRILKPNTRFDEVLYRT